MRHRPAVRGLLCPRRVSCAALLLALSLSSVSATEVRHYVEFLARSNKNGVGHSFVQIGAIRGEGDARPDVTVGLYPANFPRADAKSLMNARGRVMQTSDDTRTGASASFRVIVSEKSYRLAITHARRVTRDWRRYDLATENCNTLLFEFADRLGFKVARHTMDLSINVVRNIEAADDGRTRASWRP